MYKLINWVWKIIFNVTWSAVAFIGVGIIVAIYFKAFMFGFNLVYTYL